MVGEGEAPLKTRSIVTFLLGVSKLFPRIGWPVAGVNPDAEELDPALIPLLLMGIFPSTSGHKPSVFPRMMGVIYKGTEQSQLQLMLSGFH